MRFSLFRKRQPAVRPTIVQIVAYYPPHLGGMEVVARELSEALAADYWPVEVITSNIGAKHLPYKEQPGYNLYRLPAYEIAHTPLMPALLWRLLRAKKPAVFHLHFSQAYVPEMVWLAARLRRIPYVVHFHLDVDRSGRFGFLLPLYKRLIQPTIMRGASQVIALSSDQARTLQKRYNLNPAKVIYLPNGVGQKFLAAGERPRVPHKPLRLLFVGRLSVQKRLDRLIEALALVKAPVQLKIVGDGEDRAKLEKLVSDLDLKNITFCGTLHRKKLLDAYRQADVFVLPSDIEGMPLVLLEAMAAGLPVIGADVPGIHEHLEGSGILVQGPSPQTFAAIIDNFYEHRQEYLPALSAASRAKAAQYSWPQLADRLKELYLTITNTPLSRPLTRSGLLVRAAAWWLIFLGLRSLNWMPSAITDGVGFSFLALVPGLLTVVCLRLKKLAAGGKLVLAVGLSILELLVLGLAGNTLLQWVGVKRPLDAPYLIGEISALLLVLIILTWHRATGWELNVRSKLRELFPTRFDRWLASIPLIFVSLSILGATSLNNGGTDLWTLVMLIGIGAFGMVVFTKASHLKDSTLISVIFLISLSLLFMTSMRGWYTTGHDIQLEYNVFQLAKTNGVWQIQSFRDPYNACLSITILPTIFANVLKIFNPDVYKIFFQILFATCPATIYLLVRRWISVGLAFLATFYFVAFPTFFTDLPFLNRQEIAFIFFTLMLYIIFQAQLNLKFRRVLFLVLGVGLILSHYSTTYSVIAILFLAAGVWPLLVKGYQWLRRRQFADSAALKAAQIRSRGVKNITWPMIIILTCGSLLWTVVLTDTGSGLVSTVEQTAKAIGSGFEEGIEKSNDTNYNLFSFSNQSPAKELSDYVKTEVKPARARNPDSYYPAPSYQSYPIKIATDDTLPLTALGRELSKTGLNAVSFNATFRQAAAKLLQVLVILGFVYILFRHRSARLLPGDFIALSAGCVIFVALQVVLPVLSVDYGLLRAFQQALILLGTFIVLGSLVLFSWLPTKKLKAGATALLALVFFLSTTGVVSQLLGGYDAQLNLNNSGTYYDIYYTHQQEIAGIEWLNNLIKQSPNPNPAAVDLQADQYTFNKLSTYTQLELGGDIYPGLIRKDSYVFLGYANVNAAQSTISYNGDLVSYTYPTQFLSQQKNLIYSNGGTQIYR